MFKLEEIKLRRRSWIENAEIPASLLGLLLGDCREVEANALEVTQFWISVLRAKKIIRAAGENSCGKGLLFQGVPGLGKTTLALALIQELILTLTMEEFAVTPGKVLVRPCYFITFNDIIELKTVLMNEPNEWKDRLYQGILGESKDDAYNIRVLVIDDIGKERSSLSSWQKNLLHHVLRTRFNHGLPTIATTNIARQDWVELYGESLGSFVHEAFVYVALEPANGDLRKQHGLG
jgi:DNA replication protein DnaC